MLVTRPKWTEIINGIKSGEASAYPEFWGQTQTQVYFLLDSPAQ